MDSVPKTVKQFELLAEKQRNAILNPYQTARETTDAMANDYMNRLKKIIGENKGLKKPYAIEVLTRRDLPIDNSLHITFVVKQTIPFPEWETSVYEIDNSDESVKLWWSLPSEADAKQILSRPDLFDEKLFDDCKLMLTSEEDPTRKFVPMTVNL